jgi:eukaryotic-like serine/threonine-protein kinase
MGPTELFDGICLQQIVEREKKDGVQTLGSAAVLLGYMVQACRALGYMHERGAVHRDIKPGNIFVTRDGTVNLAEFSVSHLRERFDAATGVVVGTPAYMSPEQIRGEKADGRSDIWSIGCTIYEVLTYTKPFVGDNIAATMFAILSSDPKSLRELRPDLSPELDDLVRRTLRKGRDERYRNMGELLTDFAPLVQRMKLTTGTP